HAAIAAADSGEVPGPGATRHAQHRAARPGVAGGAGFRTHGRVLMPARTRAANIDRSRLPEPGPARTFAFPFIDKSRLPSGLSVWTVSRPDIPLIAFVLLVRRGASADPPGHDGLAALTADMLDEGSGRRSAIEIHEELARIGAQFDTDIGSDALSMSATVLSRFADRALALLSDIVVRPALRESDFSR